MSVRPLPRIAALAGSIVLALPAAGGAAADPDMSNVINTSCTYQQAVAALNAEDPATAARFNETPAAQSWLGSFLSAPPEQRQQMLQQVQGAPEGQSYVDAMVSVADTCMNY